jgi:transposase
VRQSGDGEARTGHISRQGQAHARAMLVEAAHAAIKSPGPPRAFYRRVKERRGSQVALCATARKLAVYSWHLLSKGEDYRFESATLTYRKRRELGAKAGIRGCPAATSRG